ncbi:hypothetical protein OAJ82_01590 [Alphaproteobacteria bacterium]|nr:hypothetical protein [Alphaproteobacteria bacterium]
MTTLRNHDNINEISPHTDEKMLDSVTILSDITRKDIEKSYSLDSVKGTEAYYSNRYGWTLRRRID